MRNLNTDLILGNCIFGSEKLTINADLDKYKYTGYGIGFDSQSEFPLADGSNGKKCHYLWSWYEHNCAC